MLVVVASFKAKEGKEGELQEALQALAANVEAEEGTLIYNLHKAKKDPGKFMVYEMYADKAAFELHGSTPYFKEAFGRIAQLIEGQPQLEIFQDVALLKR